MTAINTHLKDDDNDIEQFIDRVIEWLQALIHCFFAKGKKLTQQRVTSTVDLELMLGSRDYGNGPQIHYHQVDAMDQGHVALVWSVCREIIERTNLEYCSVLM